uniref:Uncharacterized protein n=1 Tax=Talaromyces marneffei PM1 TaxID=1077442 RepID=A0A093XI10_TALMA
MNDQISSMIFDGLEDYKSAYRRRSQNRVAQRKFRILTNPWVRERRRNDKLLAAEDLKKL